MTPNILYIVSAGTFINIDKTQKLIYEGNSFLNFTQVLIYILCAMLTFPIFIFSRLFNKKSACLHQVRLKQQKHVITDQKCVP